MGRTILGRSLSQRQSSLLRGLGPKRLRVALPLTSPFLQQFSKVMMAPTKAYANLLEQLDVEIKNHPSPCTRAQLDGAIAHLGEQQHELLKRTIDEQREAAMRGGLPGTEHDAAAKLTLELPKLLTGLLVTLYTCVPPDVPPLTYTFASANSAAASISAARVSTAAALSSAPAVVNEYTPFSAGLVWSFTRMRSLSVSATPLTVLAAMPTAPKVRYACFWAFWL